MIECHSIMIWLFEKGDDVSMYKKCLVSLLAVLIMVCSNVAFAKVRVSVVNHTGYAIKTISICPAGGTSWIDVSNFKTGALRNGDRANLTLNSAKDIQYWDMEAAFTDGGVWSWDGLDFFNASTITLNSDGSASYS